MLEIDEKAASAAEKRGGNQLLGQRLERRTDLELRTGSQVNDALPVEYLDENNILRRDRDRLAVDRDPEELGLLFCAQEIITSFE